MLAPGQLAQADGANVTVIIRESRGRKLRGKSVQYLEAFRQGPYRAGPEPYAVWHDYFDRHQHATNAIRIEESVLEKGNS